MTLESRNTVATARRIRARILLTIGAAVLAVVGAVVGTVPANAYTVVSQGSTCVQTVTASYFNSGATGAYGPANASGPSIVACRNNTVPANAAQYVKVAYNLEKWNGRAWQHNATSYRDGWILQGQQSTTIVPSTTFLGITSGTYRISVGVGFYNTSGAATGIRSFIAAHWGDTLCGNLPASRCWSYGSYVVIN